MNTGTRGSVFTLLEEHLARSLQWMVCQLLVNELWLCHLFQHFDGHTTGPHCFSSTVTKHFNGCEKLQTGFVPIERSLLKTNSLVVGC